MQWRALQVASRDVRLASTGETFRTLASFQGHDGESDIIKAHLVADGGDICLLTEYEDAAGARALGRTTQWPAQIVYHCMMVATDDVRDAIALAGYGAPPVQPPAPESDTSEPDGKLTEPVERQLSAITEEQRGAPTDRPETDHALMRHASMATEMHPEEAQTGGGGDPAAPAEASLEQPEAPTESLEQPATDDIQF